MAQFDKFYTKSNIAKQCYDFLCEKIPSVKDGYFFRAFRRWWQFFRIFAAL